MVLPTVKVFFFRPSQSDARRQRPVTGGGRTSSGSFEKSTLATRPAKRASVGCRSAPTAARAAAVRRPFPRQASQRPPSRRPPKHGVRRCRARLSKSRSSALGSSARRLSRIGRRGGHREPAAHGGAPDAGFPSPRPPPQTGHTPHGPPKQASLRRALENERFGGRLPKGTRAGASAAGSG